MTVGVSGVRERKKGGMRATRRQGFRKQQVALETNLDGVLLPWLYEKWIASIPILCSLIGSPKPDIAGEES